MRQKQTKAYIKVSRLQRSQIDQDRPEDHLKLAAYPPPPDENHLVTVEGRHS